MKKLLCALAVLLCSAFLLCPVNATGKIPYYVDSSSLVIDPDCSLAASWPAGCYLVHAEVVISEASPLDAYTTISIGYYDNEVFINALNPNSTTDFDANGNMTHVQATLPLNKYNQAFGTVHFSDGSTTNWSAFCAPPSAP